MKARSRQVLNKKFVGEFAKAMEWSEKERERIAYDALAYAAPKIVSQTEAMILCALSKHGYGAKRLKEFHDWFKAIAEMPADIFGKKVTTENCEEYLAKKYGLDIRDVRINFPTWEQYDAQDAKGDGNARP